MTKDRVGEPPLFLVMGPEPRVHAEHRQAKRTAERVWLSEVSNIPLQQSIRDLDKAFRSWWQGKGGFGAPRFKKRSTAQGIRLTRGGFRAEAYTLRLAKLGSVPICRSRPLPSAPSSCTIIKDWAGRYFAGFVVAVERPKLPPNSRAVGIDLGLASRHQ